MSMSKFRGRANFVFATNSEGLNLLLALLLQRDLSKFRDSKFRGLNLLYSLTLRRQIQNSNSVLKKKRNRDLHPGSLFFTYLWARGGGLGKNEIRKTKPKRQGRGKILQ